MLKIKYLSILVALLLGQISNAQTFTNQQVFNFNVGDIFIYDSPSKNYPWQRIDTVISKTISSNNAFVNYSIYSTTKTVELPINQPNLVYITTHDSLNVSYPFTNSLVFDSIVYNMYDSVPISTNAMFNYSATNLCNNNVQGYQYGQDHNITRYEYAIGLGYVRDEKVIDQNGNFFSIWDNRLVAYKNGNENCNAVGMDEIKSNADVFKINISNTNNQLFLNFSKETKPYHYSILSTNGAIVLSNISQQNMLEIGIDNLPKGLYFMQVYNENYISNLKFIK